MQQSSALPVPHGTAEQLARLSHFRNLVTVQAEELDAVAFFLLGDVGDHESRADLWEALADDADRLWHLITADWEPTDLDELTEADWARHSFSSVAQELEHRRSATAERLAHEIEQSIRVARVTVAEARRTARVA